MPYRFMTLSAQGVPPNFVAQLNKNLAALDNEAVTKTFNGASGGNSLVLGKLPNDRYGLLLYDENGIPNILIGQAPDDGRMGIWVADTGENVLELLGG